MQKIKIRIVTFILVFLAVINTIFFTEGQKSFEVKAEGIIYTNVLEDLKKDTSFDPGNYPAKADDYSLKIIQLAETVNKELFVYVYTIALSKETEEREYRPLESIKDNYPRYVVTTDYLLQQRSGIKHVNLIDFISKNEKF